jgi:hypothetical protein
MAVRIIEGVPGAGKTYYAVRHLAKNFFVKTKDGFYVPDSKKPCQIITNIDSFQPDHMHLNDCIKEAGGDFRQFFSKEYQEEFATRFEHSIVYVIDEAQMLFRRNDRTLSEVFSYFEWHRHLGQDIYLVTQNTKKLPADITTLVEYIIRAAPRVRSLTGEFKYHWISGSDKIKTEAFRPDKGVFALYKSMDGNETEKIKNPLMKTVGLALAGSALIAGGAIFYLKSKWTPEKTEVVQNESVSDNQSSVSGKSFKPSSGSPGKTTQQVQLVPTKLSHIITYSKSGSPSMYIVFQGMMWAVSEFPYPVKMAGSYLYADLPPAEGSEKGAPSDLSEERRSGPSAGGKPI